MSRLAFMTIALLLLGGVAGSGNVRAQSTPEASPAGAPVDLQAAAEYCTEKGGTVVTRQPILGANLDPANRVVLGGATLPSDPERGTR